MKQFQYTIKDELGFDHLKILSSTILLQLMEQYIPDKNYSIHFVLFYNNLIYFPYFFSQLYII